MPVIKHVNQADTHFSRSGTSFFCLCQKCLALISRTSELRELGLLVFNLLPPTIRHGASVLSIDKGYQLVCLIDTLSTLDAFSCRCLVPPDKFRIFPIRSA